MSLSYLDKLKGGYKGAPKFPTFNLYETFFIFLINQMIKSI